ncbi:ubiquitin carboxyl-terminal hydrolase [Apodospora peruviana]|uniref:Ubiquitin carboxyl-terminal hydrolase n=1 Tax=Apodospora peruviana TaxID=516989 RepID=A0AAE0I671_9PEZI|nr:ubiquitin carboxyl-terminal hydrolase [Apodospora peruviana]
MDGYWLENHPEVMNELAAKLGLSPDLEWYDVYSLDEPELQHIPRPVLALLVIIPWTPAWGHDRAAEDATMPDTYQGFGLEEPVIWFKQTIGNACGSYGLLHGVINGPAKEFILPGSELENIRREAVGLKMEERAEMLYDHKGFERAHKAVEEGGDTIVREDHEGGHFVAFVKTDDGKLWELEGGRNGPIVRGELGEGEDVLSQRALGMGLRRIIELEKGDGPDGGDLRFSCLALARKADSDSE